MKNIERFFRPSLLIVAVFAACSSASAQPALEVLKVEPPGWWASHSINPVRVMIRGRSLAGSRVEASGAGLAVAGPPKVNANGTYLFV
ncbi:MAG TPA: cyclomaltodextrinase N-terminal domain-containing protein, partial [Blastocatellia bacterium]|nr:cyclomaltodextrinase N-terminal domain-containing protein [Blastocatellia bacterium]